MNRRESIKTLTIGSLSAGLLADACTPATKEAAQTAGPAPQAGRQPFETERDQKLDADRFFTTQEMACITLLSNIIIPKDTRSGSASDAKVPEFIEFIVKDMPDHQVPMRGGLRWLNLRSMNLFGKAFDEVTHDEQMKMVDEIAWPEKASSQVAQGVAFFNRMRDLTATGFFTSEIGVKDLGYAGNKPNKWEGVPDDVLKQYGLEGV